MSGKQARRFLDTKRDWEYRARRIRVAWFTLYRSVDAWLETKSDKVRIQMIDEMIRARDQLKALDVPTTDRCEAEVPSGGMPVEEGEAEDAQPA